MAIDLAFYYQWAVFITLSNYCLIAKWFIFWSSSTTKIWLTNYFNKNVSANSSVLLGIKCLMLSKWKKNIVMQNTYVNKYVHKYVHLIKLMQVYIKYILLIS
jgi:hypothetical protein